MANKQAKAQLEARIAELETEVARLSELTMCDPLTGAYNRRAFDEHLVREVASARRYPNHPIGLIMIDLNRFKAVNDTYGHEAGDAALKLVAEVARTCVRANDIVCRFGGDEFAIILHTPADGAKVLEIGRRIALALADRPMVVVEEFVVVTVSIGGAIADDDNDFGSLLTRADNALFRAKARKDSEPSPVEC